MSRIASGSAACLVAFVAYASAGEPRFPFERRVIDSTVEIGYGVAVADLDRDSRLDILLADRREFVWYKNGDFQRRLLHPPLTKRDNVAIAARSFVEGSLPNVALGGDWDPSDTSSQGSAKYFAIADVELNRHLEIDLDADPTVHRMRFVDLRGSAGTQERRGSEDSALVIVPLHGRGNVDGQGEPVRVYAYLPILQFAFGFEKELVDASMHKTHNFDVGQWDPATTQEEIVLIGAEGARICERGNGVWTSRELVGVRGGGEIRMGRFKDGIRFLATIEPMHGDTLALYSEQDDGSFRRRELDTTLRQGHALAISDLDGDGEPEVVYGWREKDANGETGIRILSLAAGASPETLDRTIACEDLVVADVTGDGAPDVVAAGRASHDLVLFTNRNESFAAVPVAPTVSVAGRKVSYRVARGTDDALPALVFVHGWSCDSSVWDIPLGHPELPSSIAQRTRITIDLPGHGSSEIPQVRPTFVSYAHAIHAVLEVERIERAVLVGHSNGVPVVRQFLREYPERTAALVLVDGPLKAFGQDDAATRAMADRFVSDVAEPFTKGVIQGTLGPRLEEPLRSSLFDMMMRAPAETRRDAFLASLDASVWEPDPIGVPLLMVNARQPSWSAEYLAYVKEIAPHVEYIEWENVSHFLMCERPADFLAVLAAFLSKP